MCTERPHFSSFLCPSTSIFSLPTSSFSHSSPASPCPPSSSVRLSFPPFCFTRDLCPSPSLWVHKSFTWLCFLSPVLILIPSLLVAGSWLEGEGRGTSGEGLHSPWNLGLAVDLEPRVLSSPTLSSQSGELGSTTKARPGLSLCSFAGGLHDLSHPGLIEDGKGQWTGRQGASSQPSLELGQTLSEPQFPQMAMGEDTSVSHLKSSA